MSGRDASRVGPAIGATIDRSRATGRLPENVSSRLNGVASSTLARVRIHDDPAAHAAAEMLGARAFTIGSSIFWSEGQYRPFGGDLETLAHEVAHAEQQAGAARPPSDQLRVSPPSSSEEHEAARFAAAAVSDRNAAPPALHKAAGGIARIMRLRFTRLNDSFEKLDPFPDESHPTYFDVGARFGWTCNVKVSGSDGEPFDHFQLGGLQLVRDYKMDIWWEGAGNPAPGLEESDTHRTSTVKLPIRDAVDSSQTWFDDKKVPAAFAANGDEREIPLFDNPMVREISFENPMAGRTSSHGRFEWSAGFVAFISVRDTTMAPGDPKSFQHVASRYWKLTVSGTFPVTSRRDTFIPGVSEPRVTIAGGSRTLLQGEVIDGAPAEFPPIVDGPVAVEELIKNQTTE